VGDTQRKNGKKNERRVNVGPPARTLIGVGKGEAMGDQKGVQLTLGEAITPALAREKQTETRHKKKKEKQVSPVKTHEEKSPISAPGSSCF